MLRELWKSFRRGTSQSTPKQDTQAEEGHTRPGTVGNQIKRRVGHLRIQVGLDFGTSATKATYRILGSENPRVRSILFRHKSSRYPSFCIPSLASFDEDGQLLLGIEADAQLAGRPWGEGLTRFKMLVAGDQDPRYLDKRLRNRFRDYIRTNLGDESTFSAEALAATYLAYAMRLVRRELAREIRATTLDVSFNTCVPIDQRENNRVFAAFQRVVATAELLDNSSKINEQPGVKWLEAAAELVSTAKYDAGDSDTRMFLVPEAVASVAAYLISLQKRSGLHALYDIGAGTTDLSIFRLRLIQGKGTTNFWYAARSIPEGTGQIEDRLADMRSPSARDTNSSDILATLSAQPRLTPTQSTAIREELSTIWKRTRKGWSEAFGHLSNESEWRANKVHVFLAGGGASLPGAVARFQECPLVERWGPYSCSMLPTPDGYDSRNDAAPFARMSVAYGLSIPIPELEVNLMPSESPDHTLPLPSPSSLYSPSDDEGPT